MHTHTYSMYACVYVLSCFYFIASGVIDLDPYGGSTDDEGASPKISPRVSSIESDGGDTEDEIRR